MTQRSGAAHHLTDEVVDIRLRVDAVIRFATANNLSPLPVSTVDRLIAFDITREPGQMFLI